MGEKRVGKNGEGGCRKASLLADGDLRVLSIITVYTPLTR